MSDFRYTRPASFPPIVKNIIIINVLVWVAQLMFENYNLTARIGLWPVQSPFFKPYQIATHMFAHAAYDSDGSIVFFHILFNMFTFWMFGRILENVWGPKRFLFFYLACGIGAALTHMTVQYFQYEHMIQGINHALSVGDIDRALELRSHNPGYVVGASGAVMGVMVAFAYLFPNTELYVMLIPIPVKAKWVILAFIGFDLFFGLNASQGDNVAHFAHLGGALTGFIIVFIWNKVNRKTLY